MNCKPGDLAIGVSAEPSKVRNIGAIVRILRACPEYPEAWEVETLSWTVYAGKESPPGTIANAMDKHMRPLRDSDGEGNTTTPRELEHTS